LGLSVGNQIVLALEEQYEATMQCGGRAWNVIFSKDGALSTFGNSARSAIVHDIKAAQDNEKARVDKSEDDFVDVLVPVHIRTFHALYFPGRELAACDPTVVSMHSALTYGMLFTLRFSELSPLTTQHLSWSKMSSEISLEEATKNSLEKQVYELAPWPTSFVLDPRYMCIFPCSSHLNLCALRVGSVHSLQQAELTFFHDVCSGILFPLRCMSSMNIKLRAGVCHVDAHATRSARVCLLPHEDGRRHDAMYHKKPIASLSMVSWMRRSYEPCVVLDANQLATHTPKPVERSAVRGPVPDTNVDNGNRRLERLGLLHPVPGSVQPP